MLIDTVVPSDYKYLSLLDELGLRKSWLSQIGERIISGASQATENDALNASGSFAYFWGVRAARDILVPEGWQSVRVGNLELTSNPEKNIDLLVSSGNKYTGNQQYPPSTKNQKGSQTKHVVFQNSRYPYIFPEMNSIHEISKKDGSKTWFFLYHIDKKNSELRMELSLPISFDDSDLRVTGWIKRIILESIKFDIKNMIQEPEYADIPSFDIVRKIHEY